MKTLQIIIILLLLANLAATIWFGTQSSKQVNHIGQQSQQQQLPRFIDQDIRDNIYDEFVTLFNAQDYANLFDKFSPAAKAQIDKDDAYNTFQQLHDYFYAIVEGGYSHAEFLGSQGEVKQYKLIYAVKFSEKSKFGTTGKLEVTITLRGRQIEIWGYKVNAG